MLSAFQSMLIIFVALAGSVVLLALLQRIWPNESRRQHNDLIGWHLTVIGSTYAVIIGFMLFAVWTNFKTAEANAEAEANCLVDLARSARGLPAATRDKILALSLDYGNVMLSQEWPAMDRNELSPASHTDIRQLWATLSATEVRSGLEQTSLDHAFTELSQMTEYRRLRLLQVDNYLPGVLWLVLILGAVVTIVSACLFGASNFRVHFFQVIMLSVMISAVLVAIADINRPYQGSVHVDSLCFQRALMSLRDLQ